MRRPACVGNPTGRDVRAVQKAQIFQILHHVADVAADLFRHGARQGARTDRLARGKIAFDHAAKDLARAVVHVG
jgi:hypothetical protein